MFTSSGSQQNSHLNEVRLGEMDSCLLPAKFDSHPELPVSAFLDCQQGQHLLHEIVSDD